MNLQRIQRLGTLQTDFRILGVAVPVSNQTKVLLLRILQEGLQNILKHSKATSIQVCLNYLDDCVDYIIADDGVGFDSENHAKGKGLGLQNILNRANMLEGKVHINSSLKKGTQIIVSVPYLTTKEKLAIGKS